MVKVDAVKGQDVREVRLRLPCPIGESWEGDHAEEKPGQPSTGTWSACHYCGKEIRGLGLKDSTKGVQKEAPLVPVLICGTEALVGVGVGGFIDRGSKVGPTDDLLGSRASP